MPQKPSDLYDSITNLFNSNPVIAGTNAIAKIGEFGQDALSKSKKLYNEAELKAKNFVIQSGQDVTDLINGIKSGDDVTDLMNESKVELPTNDAVVTTEESVEEPSLIDKFNKLVFEPPDFIKKNAAEEAEPYLHPGLNDSVAAARLKGFIGGTKEGIGTLPTLANLTSLALPGLKGLGPVVSGANKLMGTAQLAKGAQELYKGNYGSGAANIGFGALGFLPGGSKVNPTVKRLEKLVAADKSVIPPALTSTALSPVEKLVSTLRESIPKNREQREIYRLEKAERAAKARATEPYIKKEKDIPKFMAQLSGEYTKVDIKPLRDQLVQSDIDKLVEQIGESQVIDTFQKGNAMEGLQKLLDGKVPKDYSIVVLGKVFGEDFAKEIRRLPPSTRRMIVEGLSVTKSAMSSFDFGFPFRQGINYAGRPVWFKTFIPMFKAYGSEKFYQEGMEAIKSAKNFDFKQRVGLSITDLKDLSTREESVMGTYLEKVPVLGWGARASARAQTLAANKLRSDVFDMQYKDYIKMYQSTKALATNNDELRKAEFLNPDNPYVARKIADWINVSTGRGSLGKYEAIATELNAGLFAPRLMSARIRSINRILNPVEYMKYNPVQRKEALKQALSIAGTAITTATLAKLGGADVSLNPDSTDFLKVKVGNTRLDPLGGYQQYFVPIAKVIMGTTTSSTSGKQYELGSNPIIQDKFEVLLNALLSKASPPASLAIATLREREQGGQPTNFTTLNPMENSAMLRVMPMIAKDLYEILQEDPSLVPFIIPASLGMGLQTYEQPTNPLALKPISGISGKLKPIER